MLKRLYSCFRALSIDVVLGALVCCAFLGQLLNVRIPGTVYGCLALAVWAVYTTDHLWDAYRLKKQARSFRHRFHYRYFKVLTALVVLAILTGILLSRNLPPMVWSWGAVISVMVCGYFTLMMAWGEAVKYLKEIMVSFIYAAGVFSAPLALSLFPPQGWLIVMFLQFTLLALVNLLEFSYFEMEQDRQHKFASAVLAWGKSTTRRIVLAAIMLILVLSAVSFLFWGQKPEVAEGQLILMIMALGLGCIILLPGFFEDKERFRVLGDGVFLIPAIFLL